MESMIARMTMSIHSHHGGTVAGTTGGTLLAIFAYIDSEDVVKTIVLACIGAVVSFMASIAMKWMLRKMARAR
jgi:mannitol-specific phosphotransferase system IIBC component